MVCCGNSNIESTVVDDTVAEDLSQWMTNLPEPLTNIPINNLAIPGSHNSGSYYLDPSTPIAPGIFCCCFILIKYF